MLSEIESNKFCNHDFIITTYSDGSSSKLCNKCGYFFYNKLSWLEESSS